MRDKYFPPKADESAFHCPHCGVYAQQVWFKLFRDRGRGMEQISAEQCRCTKCGCEMYWLGEKMLFPDFSAAEPAHPDMPEVCLQEYEEAASIFSRSPRSSAALIRLAIQKLMPALNESGKNINDDIKSLVQKGLPVMVQQALDVCRVIGNHAVHPGTMDINDTPEIAQNLFRIVNIIVEECVTKPKEIEAIYGALPRKDLEAIQKRDNK